MSESEYVTLEVACGICSVSRRTVYSWIQQGKLGIMRTPSGTVRVRRADLLLPPHLRAGRTIGAAVGAAISTGIAAEPTHG